MICGMKIFFSCGILVTYERRYGWCCCCCWSCCPWSCGLRSGCWGRAVQRRPVRTARLTISTDNFFSSTVSLLSNVRSPSMTSSLGCVEVNLFSSHRVFTGFVWISKGTLLVFIYWYFIFLMDFIGFGRQPVNKCGRGAWRRDSLPGRGVCARSSWPTSTSACWCHSWALRAPILWSNPSTISPRSTSTGASVEELPPFLTSRSGPFLLV